MTPRKKQILKGLKDRGVDEPCPMCGNSKFTFAGESEIPVGDNRKNNGDYVPIAIIACRNCGYITQHALGPLGLFPDEDV